MKRLMQVDSRLTIIASLLFGVIALWMQGTVVQYQTWISQDASGAVTSSSGATQGTSLISIMTQSVNEAIPCMGRAASWPSEWLHYGFQAWQVFGFLLSMIPLMVGVDYAVQRKVPLLIFFLAVLSVLLGPFLWFYFFVHFAPPVECARAVFSNHRLLPKLAHYWILGLRSCAGLRGQSPMLFQSA